MCAHVYMQCLFMWIWDLIKLSADRVWDDCLPEQWLGGFDNVRKSGGKWLRHRGKLRDQWSDPGISFYLSRCAG